ncbi:MAG: ABC transporter substrate-binding protein [Thermoleophilia bacterium]|nr:ABC transporter substrate-binding protein [Thermoleophilia bacterium]
MNKRLLTILLALVLALSVFPVVACGDDEPDTTAAPGPDTTAEPTGEVKELVIGGIAFLTGPGAAGGMACKTGWELATAKINDAGGLKIGDDTYMVKLIVEDDAMSVDQASTAAQKLIQQDGATFLMGPLVDAFKNVIYPICQQNGVMLANVDTCNASVAIEYPSNTDLSPDKPLFPRFHYANDEMMPYLFDYLQENYPDAKTVAVCGVTEECTVALYDWLEGTLAARGLERVGELEQMAPDTADYVPPVTRLLSANPDAILVAVSTPQTWGQVTKAARDLGFDGPVMCATHMGVEFALMIAEGATDIFGAGIAMADLESLPQAMQDAHAEYVAKGYSAQDEIADVYLVGYNGLWVLLQTIQAAQSVDPQEVYDYYQTITEPGLLQTLWGDGAYVGGLETAGVNAILNYPYWINGVGSDGVQKNLKQVFITVP